jgi:hypothetical protein
MHTINPSSLTDKELATFAERYFYKTGLPANWQLELIKRLINSN